jgi:ABC-2 type transport system permease protein
MSGAAATARRRRPQPGRGRPRPAGLTLTALPDALRAEWTKLRTVPEPAWILAAISVLTIAVSAGVAAATRCPAGAACPADTTKISLTGIEAGQALVALLAVLAVGGEYSTGMIRTTFTAMPRRSVVLTAKATILTGLILAAAIVAVAGSLAAGRLILPGNGFTAGRGFALVSLAHGATLRAAAGTVLYLALIGLLSLAVATIVRDAAVAIGGVLGLLYVAPIIVAFLGGSPVWQRRLERYTPVNAGLTIEDTTGLHHPPVGPWGGLGVLALWTAGTLVLAGLMLRLRDA